MLAGFPYEWDWGLAVIALKAIYFVAYLCGACALCNGSGPACCMSECQLWPVRVPWPGALLRKGFACLTGVPVMWPTLATPMVITPS